MKTDSEMTF